MSILFSQPDWQLFTNLNTLPQQAGIAKHLLPKLVIKELIDNALDTNSEVHIAHEQPELWTDIITIRDYGQGIDGTNEQIAYLFSLRRPLTSSKRLRLPQRGALGNGLRVVMGTVYCMNGQLEIATKGRKIQIIPKDDGFSEAVEIEKWEGSGTEIKITFKENLFGGKDLLQWAKYALKMPKTDIYQKKTNAFWYDSDSFYNLILSLPDDVTIIDFLKEFNPQIIENQFFKNIDTKNITREKIDDLLIELRKNETILLPKKLGKIGEMLDFQGYASVFSRMEINASKGKLAADIPVVIECFVQAIDEFSTNQLQENVFFVNKTPIVGDISFQFLEKKIWLYGCGLQEMIEIPKLNTSFFVWINILTPYMPIVSNGKEPDFSLLSFGIVEVIQKAMQHFKKHQPKKIFQNQAGELIDKNPSQKQIVLENLQKAIDKASGNGKYRYSLRQLYYALRPFVMENTGKELKYAHFNTLITEFEFESGQDLAGIYRDERGTLLHPHTQEEIKLGTKNIEKYKRPEFSFNKIIYSEKEGFFEILKEANFPEKFDCALLTSKGFASRAARDVLDLLAATNEELQFFCLHDADLSGTLIYQALQHATKARPERKVSIINLGLDAWEGLAMNLEVEKLESKQTKTPSYYVLDFDKKFDNPKPFHFPKYENYNAWEDWLRRYRVELNAMDTPTFIDWLSQKIRQYDKGKVIPPEKILLEEAKYTSTITLKEKIKQEILDNLPLDKWIEEKFKKEMPLIEEKINQFQWEENLKDALSNENSNSWRSDFSRFLENIMKK